MDREFLIFMSEKIADYINCYVVAYNLTEDNHLSTYVEKNGIYFSSDVTDKFSVHSNAKIKVCKIARTKFNFVFRWSSRLAEGKEDYKRLMNLISGYIDFKAYRDSFNDIYQLNFHLDFGCKANADLFFENLKLPNEQDFGGMI